MAKETKVLPERDQQNRPRRMSLVSNLVQAQESDDEDEAITKRKALKRLIFDIIKMISLLLVWLMFSVVIIMCPSHSTEAKMVAIEPNAVVKNEISNEKYSDNIEVSIEGRLFQEFDADEAPSNAGKISISIEHQDDDGNVLSKSDNWELFLRENDMEKTTMIRKVIKTKIASGSIPFKTFIIYALTDPKTLALKEIINTTPIDHDVGVICAVVILIGLYVLIIWDIVDRTFAALLASSAAIAVLALFNSRPPLETIVSWIDYGTIMLLFGMMILVAILSETGVFDYLAVFAYKMSKGHAWPLIFFLCFFTGILSAFLDNVTIVLLMTPVTIRLCEVMYLRTKAVLICIVIFSNLGGTITPVGDPPNLIIASNHFVIESGVTFVSFTAHMFPGVIISMIACYLQIRYCVVRKLEMDEDETMRQSIKAWKRAAEKVQPLTTTEDLLRQDMLDKVNQLKEQYRRKKHESAFYLQPVPLYIETLVDLESRYYIRNKVLLGKSLFAMGFAMFLFFFHTLPFMRGATLPWAAVLSALLLLILANKDDLQGVLAHIEWSTLLFFAALFILMEALAELGLIVWVGERTTAIIMSVDASGRLMVSLLLVLWISGLTSAFVDNIPITTMMIKVTIALARNDELNLPITPLVWALAFGTCFGGNGTLIGASANVVCAGLAGQHGYKITFMDFFKIGFPIMMLSLIVASIYLLLAHCAITWH